ncbi:MAG: peptide chain release factor N(5)-glutamine methyltransferase [Lachnospiraceae bacterium]|nr:peptide chain release factor N(5)-glutamine methyltransferase [Lachnospiraceae bacterium]
MAEELSLREKKSAGNQELPEQTADGFGGCHLSPETSLPGMGEFEMPPGASLQAACAAAQQYLADHKIEDAAVDAWYLLEYVTGTSRAAYLADRDRKMSKEQQAAYVALVNRRGAHIPLQHLTGEQEFMGLPFLVNEHVLIPRQDTETLVELALERLALVKRDEPAGEAQEVPSLRVLDLCTGSGCIAVSIAKLWEQRKKKHNIEAYASDISKDALAVARENARRLGADVHFLQGDLFTWTLMLAPYIMGQTGKAGRECENEINEKTSFRCCKEGRGSVAALTFDMIVSNPPYIRTDVIAELAEEVRSHEPRLALDGGEDGLEFYRRILLESPAHLHRGGWLLLEIGYDQGGAVADLMRKNGFSHVQVAKDLPGQDRVVSGQWLD